MTCQARTSNCGFLKCIGGLVCETVGIYFAGGGEEIF